MKHFKNQKELLQRKEQLLRGANVYLVTLEISRQIHRGGLVHTSVCEGAVLLSPWEMRWNIVEFAVPLPELLTCQREGQL